MKKSLFEYESYKNYLNDKMSSLPNDGRGERSRLAQALNCKLAYISQVLNAQAHLSLEQADRLNFHWGHNEQESDYFIQLVGLARAGTNSLREYHLRKIKMIREARQILRNRLEFKGTLSTEHQATYYSSWHYLATHLLLMIPKFQTRQAISERLGLPLHKVNLILDFLTSIGLVAEKRGGAYDVTGTRMHLGNDSAMLSKHHANWRLEAVKSLDLESANDLHYSSVVTIAKADEQKVKSTLIAAIEEVRHVVKESKEEDLYCYNFDFFRVGGK